MSTGEDEPSSGLNGRLRPRKSNASPKTTPIIQKPETKQLNEKPKRTSTPSKVSPAKPDDVSNKTAVSPPLQVLCSFCDKTFGSRQAVAKHVKRVHSSTSKHDFSIQCLYCNHSETEPNDIIRHMIDSHPNQYFACLNCQSRFSSTSELAEHKLNVCEKQKPHYRNKLRQKSPKKTKSHKIEGRHDFRQDSKQFSENHGFNGIVISCELKPSHVHEADIEDNIPTNLILPPSKSLANAPVIEKNAVIVLDPLQISTANLQWNKRIPTNFNFHNTDADQILSRLGVVHRGPRTGEPNRRDWLKIIDETNQKFERCFDTSFYSKVASNVQENLAKFLDGSCNFNPDPDNTIKTRKLKNSVAINTAEGFPILLAFEQYSRNVFDGYMPRSIAPKHKWKWDNLEHDKTLSPEQIKRDSHANNCIITLVSSLDIWTQLCMRQKFEDKFKTAPIEKKAEKRNIIGKELKEILEKRELPTQSSQVVKYVNPSVTRRDDLEFPASLGLAPATPNHDIKPAVLSGEWVRPRCYICCACGYQARDSRALTSHITTQHPNAQIQHYEIVGERLLNSDISKHLYVPPSQANGNRTRPLRGFRECTKCKKSISLEDLHQHMLDCAGDMPTVRRKCRARPFGVRKRRTRLPDNTIRKKIRKDIRTRDRHRKTLMRPREKNRSDVGDAETIRKMLADLPAKRHRVLVNPLNSNLRPRRKFDKQRNKLKMKKIITDDVNKKSQGSVQSSFLNVGIEKLKAANQEEADSRMTKSNNNQASNRQNSTSKRNSPLNTKRTLRLRQTKGTSDQGSDGKKCADSGDKSGSTRSGSGGSGEAPFNTRENGNQSNNSNGHDNQQPGCSRQNDNNRESSGQPPNVPLKHSIARLTANTGTHDKSVQFHHLFLVQQECNNIPQHVPTRQRILFENEAVVTKLDKPPLNNNHGGTMDPTAQKSKLNKPRKGLNDCIAMLKNKLVEPSSQEQVSIQCDIESPSTSKAPAKNYKPPNQTCKVTHEIAIQCADLDSDEPLAQALMRERRASQRQQALANIAKQAERDGNVQSTSQEPQQALANIAKQAEIDGNVQSTSQERQQALANIAKQAERDGNVKSTSQERQEGQVEESPKKDKAKSKTPVTDTPKIDIASQRQQALANIAKQSERDGNVQSTSQERQEGQVEESPKKHKAKSKTPVTDTPKIEIASQRQQALANIAKQLERDGNVQSTSQERQEGQVEESPKKHKAKSKTPVTDTPKIEIASQRQQALANIAKQSERDGNVQSTSQERPEGQVEESPKKHKAKSKTPVTDTPKIEIAAQSNSKNGQNNECPLEKDKGKIEVFRAENDVMPSVPLKGRNDCQQEQTKNLKDTEKVQLAESNNSAVVSIANVCQSNYNINSKNKVTTKPNAIPESPECPAQNILPKKKRNLKGHQEKLKNEKAPSLKGKPTVEKKEKVTKETQKKNKGIAKKLSNTENKKIANLKPIVSEKSIFPETIASHAIAIETKKKYPGIGKKISNTENKKVAHLKPIVSEKSILPETIASHAISIETKKKYPKRNKTKLETVFNVSTEVLDVGAEKPLPKENPKFKKAIDKPIVFTEVTKDELKNPKKTPLSEPQKNIPSKQKSDAVIPRTHDKEDKPESKPHISENLPPEITKTDSIVKSIEKENGTKIGIHSQKSGECHKNLVPVIAVASNSTMETQASFVEPNTENITPKEDDSSVYSFKQISQNLTIQDSCEDLSMKEHTELHPNIPPAHCNIHMDSIIPIPLDLSGKISSTQSDSPAPYPISNYDDTYETLDLSNKNPNRDSTFNRDFIDEEVVDLRVKYPSHMHYESDLSMQSMPEEATDLSITNEQLPKDLSLKNTNRSSSRICAMQGADYSNMAPNRSNYESCSTSRTYDENACLDFSLKDTARINHPTDLSGKRDSRIEPLVSTSSHIENRSTIESNSMLVSGTANISNTLNYNNPRMNTYGAYNKLASEGMINHNDRTYINQNPIISSEHIPKDSYEPAINLLKRKTYLEPEDLIAAQELTKDYYTPTRTNVSSGIIISESNEQLINTKENYTSITKMPLCISESVKTSIPEYNLSNRVIVTSTKKYESTTPVYTHANACISFSKVETNNSDSPTNSFMSIPGNTITNTTSVYTLAGTTTGNPINYAAECNAISIDIQSQSLKSVNDVTQSPYQTTDKSAEVIVIEDKLQWETERKQENLDQDPDIAKKIALLPKELVEILGTMPVDHRKQLLNVLPQYVSNASKSTTQLSNIDQSYSQKSMTLKSSLSPDLNKTVNSNLDATVDKRHQLHVPTTPPSTLPAPSSQLSPTSISSSLLLTPPTPNIVRQVINVQRDLKTAVCESSKNINSNIIDLTEDDNSQTMPEAEVHTTTEITNMQTFMSSNDIQSIPPKSNATKTNNDKTASLRAVRIKTQSERQRSIFPDIKVRKDSSEVPVTPLQHIDTREKVDTKGLKIQQGEISSSQCINKNIECEISSSVSLNTEHEVKSDEYLKAGEKEILQPNMIVGTSCEVGTNQILDRVPSYKRYDVCSTTLDKSNDSDDSKDNVQVSTVSPPIQSDNIISNNNNVVLKPKKDNDIILSSEVKGVSTEQITKTSDDDSSDDDVSLAVIVKQRSRDKLDIKIDIHPTDNDVITNSNSVTSSVSGAETKTDTSDASKTDVSISGESESKVLKNTNTDPVITDVKNKKSRKTRRSNNLSVLKSFQHTTDSDSDINKENTKILHSENTKNKEDDFKQTHKEVESGCVSSSNSEKDIIKINASHSDDTKNKIHEGQDVPKKDVSANDIPQVDSSLDKLNKKKLLEPAADVQTSIKNTNHNSSQESAKPDIIGLQKSLNTKVVSKKVEIKIHSTDIDKISCVDAIENEPFKLTEDGTESTTESLKQQQNTVTPLRRSRRGKSLFIDSNVVSAEESSLSVDIISEQKMPLTKKQLIFSKLLLDEEHNVPNVSNNCEKLDNQATAEPTPISSPNVEHDHVIQNYGSDTKIEQQTSDSLAKTNKRKKSVQVKKKNKKKKLQQECSTLTEHKNQFKDDSITTLKKDQKLVVQKLIETLKDDIDLSKEKQNSEQSSSTTPDKKDYLVKKTKILIDDTLDVTLNEVEKLQSKNSSVEKRKPDEASDIDSAMTSLPKKSKINDTNKEEVQVIPKNQEDIKTKKVLMNLDPKIADNKVKTRTTCYNNPIAAKRPRSKSVFVNSSDYYDPYDIDLEEMNETPKSINRKLSLRKPSKTRKTPADNFPNKSHVKNKRLSECCDAVPSTSKTEVEIEKTQNKVEKEDLQVLKKTLVDTKESISDSDDSSKSDVPLKKYVEEKEKKMLDNIEKSNISKQVDNIKHSSKTTNSKTKKKVKRSSVLNNKIEETKNQNAENEAQLRSEQFMESFGFFSERKPRKSNLLATKKISETLHIIANETDDVYFGLKERSNKKISEKRHVDEEKSKGNSNSKETKQDKKAAKRGRKKKNSTVIECSYCQLCKKEFRRPDNFLRHQMSVAHVSKISEIELNVKVQIAEEEPNYLVAFKLQLDRVKMLHEKIATRKKLSLPTYDIIIPNLEEMLADAKRSVREKRINNRGLSRDEALFIDCCELLKGSHNKNVRKVERVRHCSSLNCTQSSTNQLDWFSRSIDDTTDHKNDGDVDSITARNILESDEVRNLEKDLISGLQEAAKATKRNIATFNFDNLREIIPDGIIKLATSGLVNANYGKIEKNEKSCQPKIAPKRSPECKQKMPQRSPEYKEKMYPDINIESIDMFEDKFDKIKRKCRSQAAAASKQPQATPEANASYKIRKNKKKGKKKIRNHQNTVLTKAALKGFDGIKVSIVTTEINMSGIMSSARKSSKKKKKNQSKRKRERKSSEVSSKTYDSRQDDPPQKKLDIYEFMDTDDAEIFDFRPSTIMERFKSIGNKEIPSTSKNIAKYNEAEVSSDSASDGDDFVYMSDDYVCSDDETENSVISCEIKNIVDQKKSPHKRKDTTEKSAVMGKIFKHNALRTEKKISKNNDIEQPKANLDQLFDSLLEEKPQSSKPNETITSKSNEIPTQQYLKVPSPKRANKPDNDYEYDIDTPKYDDDNFHRDTAKDDEIEMQASKVARRSTSFSKKRRSTTPTKRPVQPSLYAIPPTEDPDAIEAGNKYKDSLGSPYSERSATKNITPPRDEFDIFLKRKQTIASPESMDESNSDDASYNRRKSTEKSRDIRKMKPVKSHDRERRVSFDCNSESLDAANMSDDAGVARQRVRRKCTVGKQNILAETWSSESEPDGMPPRPNSAESVVGTNRRRKGRKREGHSGKKPKLAKRSEVERASKGEREYESSARGFARPGPSLTAQGVVRKGRAAPSFWSEGEEEQEHVQQHGWIVGDSHKKLVTMLAHAKGRKRDDKRPLLE